ncbi:MAG: flagellar hook-basal body complex protein FliE [Proteobacteria bacterium]|nr:flagellar hook-basal body complex protein FliE [Pseudomonadota bacterium]
MAISNSFGAAQEVLGKMREIQSEARKTDGMSISDKARQGTSFMDHLKEGVMEVNQMHKTADKMAMDLAAGKSENLHETMLATTQAEIGFNLMVQLRNRALEAYQEVMRMQV